MPLFVKCKTAFTESVPYCELGLSYGMLHVLAMFAQDGCSLKLTVSETSKF